MWAIVAASMSSCFENEGYDNVHLTQKDLGGRMTSVDSVVELWNGEKTVRSSETFVFMAYREWKNRSVQYLLTSVDSYSSRYETLILKRTESRLTERSKFVIMGLRSTGSSERMISIGGVYNDAHIAP